ncbi:MAG: FtsX-like permease family protein, partial [Pseudolysinimonas sp.]
MSARSGSALPRRSRAGFRLAFLLAARNARRSPARSFLIAALIALPVVAMTGAATVGLSMVPSPAQAARAQLGQMAASLSMVNSKVQQDQAGTNWNGDQLAEGVSTDPREFVPASWRVVPLTATSLYLTTAHGVANLDAEAGRTWDPAFAGRFTLLEGRAPLASDELLVTPSALTRLGVKVGGTVSSGDGSRTFTIVGIMRDATLASAAPTVFGGLNAFPTIDTSQIESFTWYLAGPPVTWTDVHSFNSHGALVQSRALTAGLTTAEFGSSVVGSLAALIGIGGAFLLFEIALLAGAAFLVGARQQQRGLAVLASVGADRRLLSRSVAVGGIVLGLVGAIGGAILGVGAAGLVITLFADGSDTQFYSFAVNPLLLGGIVLVAVLAAWAAAAVPGRAASRFDVVAALRGARRPTQPSRLAPALGAVTLLVGLGIAVLGGVLTLVINGQNPVRPELTWIGPTLIVVGSIVVQLGAILGVPLLLRLVARASSRATASARMATRDLARNSARAVPAIAAVMSTVFIAAFLMAALSGGERSNVLNHEYRAPLGTAVIQFLPPDTAQVVPDAARYVTAMNHLLSVSSSRLISGAPDVSLGQDVTTQPTGGDPLPQPRVIQAARCIFDEEARSSCHEPTFLNSGGYGVQIVVGTASELPALLGHAPSEAAKQALADGSAVSFYPQYVQNGVVTIDWWTPAQIFTGEQIQPNGTPTREDRLPAVVDSPTNLNEFGIMISPATAERLRIPVVPQLVMAHAPQTTTAQQDSVNGYLQSHSVKGQQPAYFYIETGPDHFAGPFV